MVHHLPADLGARLVARETLLQPFWTGGALEWQALPEEDVPVQPHLLHALCSTGSHPEYNTFFASSTYRARAVSCWRLANVTFYPTSGAFLRLRDGLFFSEAMSGLWADETMSAVPGVVPDAGGGRRFVGHRDMPVRVIAHPRPLVLLSNSAWCNYGHFFLDGLCSLVPLLDAIRAGRLDVLSAPLWHDWHRQALRALGVPDEAVVEVTEDVVLVSDLIVASPISSDHTRHPSRLALELFARLRHGAACVQLPSGIGPRLYLRRTTKRFLSDAAAFEAFLVSRGFSIIEPESFPIAEQVAIFAQARVIVSIFGASLLNVGFAPPGCRVLEIRPDTSNDPWTMHLCARMGHDYASQVAEVRDDEVGWQQLGTRRYDHDYPMHIDLAVLRAAVEGLLGR